MGRLRSILHALALIWTGVAVLTITSEPARAQAPALNPDSLSFFEEPLAFQFFGFTVTYNQLVDVPVVFDFTDDHESIYPRTVFQGTIERQLPNAITVGATYLGVYDRIEDDEYEDRWAAFASSVWGRLSVGEVNETVREATRRWRGTGNADLEFDDVLGTLLEDDFGAAYHVRLAAYTLNAAVDEDGNSDFGITYERPNKYADIRFTGRLTFSEYWSLDDTTLFDTFATGFVTQVEYGSFAADVGLGFERLESTFASGDRYYVSAGVHYKVRRLTVSAEGHWGEIDDQSEKSAALGLRYDIARGLSANLGYNYAKSIAAISGIPVLDVDISELIASMRYEF